MSKVRGGMKGMGSCAAVVIALAALAGCRTEKVQTYRIAREEGTAAPAADNPHGSMPPGTTPGSMPAEMPSGVQGGAVGGAPEGAPSLHWKAPAGWAEKPPSSMRVGSFLVPGPGGPADMSVVVLAGSAGGDLANVDRWRGQIGLEPLGSEDALAKVVKQVKSAAGDFLVVDFVGTSGDAGAKTRLIAAILSRGGESWFFKLTGPDATVAAARGAFTQFLESVHVLSTGG